MVGKADTHQLSVSFANHSSGPIYEFIRYSKHLYSIILNPYQFLCEWGKMCLNQYGVSNVRFKGLHVRPLYTHVFFFFEWTCSCVIIHILHLLVKTMYFTHAWRHVIIVKLGFQRVYAPVQNIILIYHQRPRPPNTRREIFEYARLPNQPIFPSPACCFY